MKLTREQQSAANCLAWWRAHGGIVPRINKAEPDRVWFDRCGLLLGTIKQLAKEGVLVEAWAKNHGETVLIGYREARTRTAAQVIIHTHAVEMDFDHWHPWDLVGLVGHGIEVLTNKLGNRKTCPYRIARALRGRGIDA
jgi:hypothetical protein